MLLFQASCIERIGGDKGDADGEIVLERIVHCLISPTFLPQISWTGKGKQKEKKVALCRLTHLIDLIKVTTVKSDRSFTDAQFKDKLIYGILKRAPSKYGITGKNDDKTKASTSQPEKPVLNDSPNNQSSQPAPMQQQQQREQLDHQLNHDPPMQQHQLDNQLNHFPPNNQPSQTAPTQQQQPQLDYQLNHYPPNGHGQPPMPYYPPYTPQPYYPGNANYYNGNGTYFPL